VSAIRDISLKDSGRKKIQWAARHMPVLESLARRYEKEKPFEGLRIALSIHLEAKTAHLVEVLARGGAQMSVTGSNPLSTQDDVCAALVDGGIEVFAWHGTTDAEYDALQRRCLAVKPHIVVDDGGDLVHLLSGECREDAVNVIGGCEETTTGVMRLRGLESRGMLPFPMIAVNDARCKNHFDNPYGTGQSVFDAIMRNTNMQIAGKTVVVAGYGHVGRGVAKVAQGLGARVIVCEVDPVKALEAVMDGMTALPMDQAALLGDLFITVTGCRDVITARHFEKMKEGALLSNAGHFDVEVDGAALAEMAVETREMRPNVQGYWLANGKTLYLLCQGRLVNLAGGDGHPIEIMDMSFALQAMGVNYLKQRAGTLENRVYLLPKELDDEVARLRLSAEGFGVDALTPRQQRYLQGLED
jgi:adenosylhomocysteinase